MIMEVDKRDRWVRISYILTIFKGKSGHDSNNYNPSYSGSEGRRIINLMPALTKLVKDPISKANHTNKKARDMSQVVEHLSCICKALGSLPSLTHTHIHTHTHTHIHTHIHIGTYIPTHTHTHIRHEGNNWRSEIPQDSIETLSPKTCTTGLRK
jgi:hypothetical protein